MHDIQNAYNTSTTFSYILEHALLVATRRIYVPPNVQNTYYSIFTPTRLTMAFLIFLVDNNKYKTLSTQKIYYLAYLCLVSLISTLAAI